MSSKRFSLILVVTGLIAVMSASCAGPKAVDQKSIDVLFIGNSYTFFNDMPSILEALSDSANLERPICCRMAAVGSATLESLWNNPDIRGYQKSYKWSMVVLQEQSTRPIEKPELFRHYAELWAKEIKSHGAKPLLYMTWARQSTPQNQSTLTQNYRTVGRECGGMVVPVGEAWQAVRREKPGLELFIADGSHPTPAGSYLTACVFFAVIANKSPVGLPAKLTIRGEDGAAKWNLSLSQDVARYLQQAAEDAVRWERNPAKE